MTSLQPEAADVRSPLIVGVIGHRDLRPELDKALADKARSIFFRLKRRYPSTPLVLLSALAEGADRLVARVALEPRISARLVVPLPMDREAYEKGFATAESLAEFKELFGRAHRSFVMRLSAGSGPAGVWQPDPRSRQYREEAARFIAAESQVLIALWDGRETDLPGGIAQVVRLHTEGISGEAVNDLERPEGFPVYHILTPRKDMPDPAGEQLAVRTIYPETFKADSPARRDYAGQYFQRMFRRLDAFNRRVSRPGRRLIANVTRSRHAVIADDDEALSAAQRVTLQRYAFADALAVRFQRRTTVAQVLLHWALFLAVLCFVLFAQLPASAVAPQDWWMWLACSFGFAALGLAAAVVCGPAWLDLETDSRDYRAVAEGLRVTMFWGLAGVRDSVTRHYLRKQRSEMDWIRNGLRAWRVESEEMAEVPGLNPRVWEGVRVTLVSWVKNQRQSLEKTLQRQADKALSFQHRVTLIFLVAALVATSLFVISYTGTGDEFLEAGIIATVTLLSAGAVLRHYSKRMAFAEHASHCRRLWDLFVRTSQLVDRSLASADVERAQECLRILGAEALEETGDWALRHRARPLEMPPD